LDQFRPGGNYRVSATLVSGLNTPEGIAVSGGNLWVANYNIGTIGEYNATTGAAVNATLVSGLSNPHFITVVPEPGSVVLAVLGFAGLAAWGWRRHLARVVTPH
jgi:hypothetical protein